MKPKIVRPNPEEEYFTDEGCYILESWNTDKDSAVSIARARVRPGVTTRLHRIKETVERYLIIQGLGEVRVGELAPEPVAPGDVVVIPENMPQQIKNSGKEDLVFYCICTPRFSPERYEALE